MKWPIIVFCAALLPFSVFAQEEPAEKTTAQSEVKKADTNEKSARDKADDYRPTEEISEDLSVSYPVDI